MSSLAKVVKGGKGLVKAVLTNEIIAKEGSIEKIGIGDLVLIDGRFKSYLGMVIDTSYETRDELISGLSFFEGSEGREHLSRIVKFFGDSLFHTSLDILLLGEKLKDEGEIRVASSLPSHFSEVKQLTKEEVREFFGSEDCITKWGIGTPETCEVYPRETLGEIPVDVKALSNLSFGIFGKTGTGKTFLGNLLASYITAHNELRRRSERPVVLLIFDMHSEYGVFLKDARGERLYEGVGQKLKDYFEIYTPDHQMAEEVNKEVKNKLKELTIPITGIEVEKELVFMKDMLGLTDTFINYLPKIERIFKSVSKSLYGQDGMWKRCFWEYVDEKDDVLREIERKVNDPSLMRSLVPNMRKLKWVLAQDFVTWNEGTIDEVIELLLGEDPRSVIISMGKYSGNSVAYMLIANYVARKLKEKIDKTVQRGEELRSRIIIFLEEAHNFLGPKVFLSSPFGVIAREYRKRGINLAVIDQRPSELDENVISMLWSKFIFALTSKKDIETALLGVAFQAKMEEVVPKLPERRALITGLVVKFPVVVEIADYGGKISQISEMLRRRRSRLHKVRLYGEGEGTKYKFS